MSTQQSTANTDALAFANMTVLEKLNMIEAKLKEEDPMLGHHMTEIHKTLLAHEELVHILSDAQIHVLMAGMQKYKQIQIVEAAVKKPSAGRGKAGKQDVDDF